MDRKKTAYRWLLLPLLVLGGSVTCVAQGVGAALDCGDSLFADKAEYHVYAGGVAVPVVISLARLEQHLPHGADFTNVQFNLSFPEGVRPVSGEGDNEGSYATPCSGVADHRGGTHVVFTSNLDVQRKYPDHLLIGLNVTLHPIHANPCELVEVYVAADAGLPPGRYSLMWHSLKYVDSGGESLKNRWNGPPAPLCTLVVEAAP